MSIMVQQAEMRKRSLAEVRSRMRSGLWQWQTSGLAEGYVQTNLVILPADQAADFQRFCELNPKPCPLLDITAPGSPAPLKTAPTADLRSDLPRYRIYEDGELIGEDTDIHSYWRDDLVGFLLGCSFTFEHGLVRAGIPMRHLQAGLGVPMWRTNRECAASGPFHGPLVVSMRPIPAEMVELAGAVSERYPQVHGGPVHAGDPAELGIDDLSRPDWGDPPIIEEGDVPVFWACGVTPQAVAMASKPPFMITHAPGHMFITDLRIDDLETN